jgi:hypothetical protein
MASRLYGLTAAPKLLEVIMNAIIDLSSEVLIDRSRVRNPHLLLLLAALGQELVKGSAWVAVDKRLVAEDESLVQLIRPLNVHLESVAA